jgi:hypothetical protein
MFLSFCCFFYFSRFIHMPGILLSEYQGQKGVLPDITGFLIFTHRKASLGSLKNFPNSRHKKAPLYSHDDFLK